VTDKDHEQFVVVSSTALDCVNDSQGSRKVCGSEFHSTGLDARKLI